MLATAAHGDALRRLAREETMPGWIRLAYAREPDWFRGQAVLGHVCQTVVALDDTDAVVVCGVRALRQVYIDGCATHLGYLCGLRSLPRARGSSALAHAFRFFRQLHDQDRRVSAYLTTIVEGNVEAIKLLTSGRASLPAYLDRGRVITTAIFLGRRRTATRRPQDIEILSGQEVPLNAILDFLRAEGSKNLFFPVLELRDLKTPQWRDFDPSRFYVARRGETILGVTAAWDQSACRQTLVAGYAPALRLTRPLLNVALRIAGHRPLPSAGQILKFFHTALTCIRNNDPVVFTALLERLHADHRTSSYDYFVVGLHERNPLRAALRGFLSIDYISRLYAVCWEDGRSFCKTLIQNRIPHIETAML